VVDNRSMKLNYRIIVIIIYIVIINCLILLCFYICYELLPCVHYSKSSSSFTNARL
jgi:ABC-type uncharacterized transport system permease subunit